MAKKRNPSRANKLAANASLSALAENRVIIEDIRPQIDCGRFPVKRVAGEVFSVTADIFSDGHDVVAAAVKFRAPGDSNWSEAPMHMVDNDMWAGDFKLGVIGRHEYTIIAWTDPFSTWRLDTKKKQAVGAKIDLEISEGIKLVENAAAHADEAAKPAYEKLLTTLNNDECERATTLELLLGDDIAQMLAMTGPRVNLTRYPHIFEVTADRALAAAAAWYEMMPRSQPGDAHRHGTFDDVIARLAYVRDLGFDVLYFPPIHPIGKTNRKGANNSLHADDGEPGSPYAIGSSDGGHDAIHPELGTFEDFARLQEAVRAAGMEIALDFAIQCSPDHPWIREHPEWFDWRPDGTIKFAENPPKKYEDIVNVHFYRESFPSLWYALRDVVLFWIEKGVKIFRVDNPHTKPVPFWEWLIRDVQTLHPDAVFLAEAFTRPKMMKRLGKAGFTQSYSYFTWRNTKPELTEYLTELTTTEASEYMRPNFFTNTPDINPFYLQTSGRAGFRIRAALAALLNPLYGIYNGFELCEATAIPGKEEYGASEKYELKVWDWERPGNIKDDIRTLNRIRRENPAFAEFKNLRFYNFFNDEVLYFGKLAPNRENLILAVVSLNPHNPQNGQYEVPLWEFGLPDSGVVDVEDLVEGHRFQWAGKTQSLTIDPQYRPYYVWRITLPEGAQ